MRHFIVSDLHWNGYVYDSIMTYLDNEYFYGNDAITLHINGDLIDRGKDSGSMLVDVYNRINNNVSFKINYLGGNHELMMYQYNMNSFNWLVMNGGEVTCSYLLNNYSKEEIDNIIDFIGNLNIYRKFDEKINGKQIVLVHACYINNIERDENLKVRDNNRIIEAALWTRKNDSYFDGISIGNDNYLTIIGHTPVNDIKGFEYYLDDNVLNIDGGSSCFVVMLNEYFGNRLVNFDDFGDLFDKYSHVPLVEIDDLNGQLKILTFNHKNEIISGNYFICDKVYPMNNEELISCRNNLRGSSRILKREIK